MIPHLHPHAGDCEHACCLKIEHLSVHIGGETILDNIDLHMHCGQMVALIGPNGAGKSTLIRDGAFAEFVCIPARNVIAIDESLPEDVVSFFDAFGNATHTALMFPLIGEDVLITGAGPIGIIATHSGPCGWQESSAWSVGSSALASWAFPPGAIWQRHCLSTMMKPFIRRRMSLTIYLPALILPSCAIV